MHATIRLIRNLAISQKTTIEMFDLPRTAWRWFETEAILTALQEVTTTWREAEIVCKFLSHRIPVPT